MKRVIEFFYRDGDLTENAGIIITAAVIGGFLLSLGGVR